MSVFPDVMITRQSSGNRRITPLPRQPTPNPLDKHLITPLRDTEQEWPIVILDDGTCPRVYLRDAVPWEQARLNCFHMQLGPLLDPEKTERSFKVWTTQPCIPPEVWLGTHIWPLLKPVPGISIDEHLRRLYQGL